MRKNNYNKDSCSQCCTPYKSEKQAKICEIKCRNKESCNTGITIDSLDKF